RTADAQTPHAWRRERAPHGSPDLRARAPRRRPVLTRAISRPGDVRSGPTERRFVRSATCGQKGVDRDRAKLARSRVPRPRREANSGDASLGTSPGSRNPMKRALRADRAVGGPVYSRSLPRRAGARMTTLEMHWNPGAEDCSAYTGPPLEVHPLDARTFVLRESLCATWEAPFMYLLVGQERGLLIDTGDVADPGKVPLASTVTGLLPSDARGKLPLLVVHSHSHTDHRAGDPQLDGLPAVRVLPADLDHGREYFGFTDWPNGTAHVDLGGRRVDVLPAPGHSPAHLLFYDQDAGFLFSGDFLMPGRLLV